MDAWRKCICVGAALVGLLLSAGLFCGCVSKSKAQARAQVAYLAGQNAALRQQPAQDHGHLLQQGVEHDRLQVEPLAPGEGEQLADQLAAAPGCGLERSIRAASRSADLLG